MKNGKSPGSDGFTVEFYKFFWNDIKTLLIDSFNYAFTHGELSLDQKRGILTLIPKKDKSRLLLKNWRPISLLNTDYKILTKALAKQIKRVLPSIINRDQTGYLKGRYIGENIRTVSDLIEYTSLKQMPGIILLIDFEKAFDTINWTFILKSLELFNFGPNLMHWIKVLYTSINSCVLNNGNASNFFTLERGIRQGCPVSPYLFIIAVEIMAIAIRSNKEIHGIKINNTEFKLSQLADDTTMFLSDFFSVQQVLQFLDIFHKISGLKLNKQKTSALCIGSLSGMEVQETFNLTWTKGPITTLGVTITTDEQTSLEQNFYPRLKKMGNIF